MSDPENRVELHSGRLPGWRRRLQLPLLFVAGAALPIVAIELADGVPALLQESRHASFGRPTGQLGFDLSQLRLPLDSIRRGGPPKDGIPALSDPKVVAAEEADHVSDEDEVIGVVFDGVARAYPLKHLDYHEIVNDTIGDRSVAVTYCPLCDSSVVFDRRIGDQTREFGVSGLLYNSNVLMYDRQAEGAESLWTQMGAVGVSGPRGDDALSRLPIEVTTWMSWRERHPETTVLSSDTGHSRRYDRSAYSDYFAHDSLMFPVGPLDDRLPAKTPVLAVTSGDDAVAYVNPGGLAAGVRRERVGAAEFNLVADTVDGRLRIERPTGDAEWCYTYWFAWAAFHPETRIVDTTSSN